MAVIPTRSRLHPGVWLAVGGLVLAGAAATAWWSTALVEAGSTPALLRSGPQQGQPPGPTDRLTGGPDAADAADVPTRPANESPDDWNAVQHAVQDRAAPPSESLRLAAYMRFQRAYARWRELQDTPHAAERQAAAREVLAQLPERLARRDLSEADALAVLPMLTQDAQPDLTQRAALFDDERLRLRAAMLVQGDKERAVATVSTAD